MNKNRYQKPVTEVIFVNSHSIVCASPGSFTGSGQMELGTNSGSGEGVTVDSRRTSFWDDEE